MTVQNQISERHRNRRDEALSSTTQRFMPEMANAPTRIKVVGVGSGGCNAVKRLMDQPVPSLTYGLINTEETDVEASASVDVIKIGTDRARAWGGGYQTEDDSLDCSANILRESFSDVGLIFITAGMGRRDRRPYHALGSPPC